MIKENDMLAVLEKELVPALGCTEPIAIAYASAKARETLGTFPEKIVVKCSGNIIKNVKSVVVPMTKNLRGIEAATIIGCVGGKAEKLLECLVDVTEEDVAKTKEIIDQHICTVELLETPEKLHVVIEMTAGDQSSMVELMHEHTGITKIEKNGVQIFNKVIEVCEEGEEVYESLSISSIIEFAKTVDIEKVKPLLSKQIKYNTAIANEGLAKKYGASIGSTLLQVYGDTEETRMRALPAAGSDARMNGCELPVIINSGSGNQGMTVSLPVIEFAKATGVNEEQLLRALCISNLYAIYIKHGMGRLSAYCGAVGAGAAAGAAITYLKGGNDSQIVKTLTNALGNVSGIVCDGAKSSCAAKIASSVEAALLASTMSLNNRNFMPGDGIIKENDEKTLQQIVKLAKDGMKETDDVILDIMLS